MNRIIFIFAVQHDCAIDLAQIRVDENTFGDIRAAADRPATMSGRISALVCG